MRETNRYMDPLSRMNLINRGAVLVLRFVNCRVVVHGPESFNLRLWQDLAVRPVEDANRFAALDLEKPTAFTIDVIGSFPVRRVHENQRIALFHYLIEVFSRQSNDFVHASVEQFCIVGIFLRTAQEDPSLRCLKPVSYTHL